MKALRDKTLLSQGAGGGYDVVLFDVIWPAEYATNKVLVDVTDRITPDMKSGDHAGRLDDGGLQGSAPMACPGSSTPSTCSTTRTC